MRARRSCSAPAPRSSARSAGMGPRPLRGAGSVGVAAPKGGHGLVVVGSHVGQTSRQVAALRARGGITALELDVQAMVGGGEVAAGTRGGSQPRWAIRSPAVHQPRRGRGPGRGREPGHRERVSADLSRTVREALAARPAWVVAKGGITSHDVRPAGWASAARWWPASCSRADLGLPPGRGGARAWAALRGIRRQRRGRRHAGPGRGHPEPSGRTPDADRLAGPGRDGWADGGWPGPLGASGARVRHRPERAAALARDGVRPAGTRPARWPPPTWPRSWSPRPDQLEHALFGPDGAAARCPPGGSCSSWPRSGPGGGRPRSAAGGGAAGRGRPGVRGRDPGRRR